MVYGLQHLPALADAVSLTLTVPSVCAQLLQEQKADLALLPVGTLEARSRALVLPDYCIGANDTVETVCILSHVPLTSVQNLYLDPDSRTSVLLARILLAEYWDLYPHLAPLPSNALELGAGALTDAVLLIGDKVFEFRSRYEYSYDLAAAWHALTHLPMVFAVWASRAPLNANFIALFNQAMQYGFEHIDEALQQYNLPPFITESNALEYLTRRIDYRFDKAKHQALELYLQKVRRLPDINPIFV